MKLIQLKSNYLLKNNILDIKLIFNIINKLERLENIRQKF